MANTILPDVFNGEHYSARSIVVPASWPRQRPGRATDEAQLRLVIDDYTVLGGSSKGNTWVMTHGTSFNRQLWKLIIDELLQLDHVRSCTSRIITIDAANHGDSALLNSSFLDDHAHWPDFSRDILHVLQYLECQKPMVGIGHSFGGGILCHAAMMQPDLFAATIFVEPILFVMPEQDQGAAQQASRRRDTWSSLDEVRQVFSRSRGLADWNATQLDTYANHGTFAPFPDQSIRMLKTPKKQEAATYAAAPHPDLLNLLGSSQQKHHFIFGGNSRVIDEAKQSLVSKLINTDSTVQVVADAGHLVVSLKFTPELR
ncbi:Alpha/beta hydrolase-like protein 2 [Elsinoe fawcettii]|nr:Alpha/beta hydrolase-like protein 2 [Elsinoe fawcettii]